MKRPQLYLASGTLIVTAAFAGGSLTSAVLGPGQATGAEQRTNMAAATAAEAPAPAAASVDPCKLITEAEAAVALGTQVTQLPSPGQCTYVAADTSARGLAVAVPNFAANRSQLKAGAEQTATSLSGTSRSISAGDESYAVLSTMVSQGLGIKGGIFLVVALTNPSGTPDQQATRLNGLLVTAFGRL